MSKKKEENRGRPREHDTWTAALLAERARAYFNKCDSRTKQVAIQDGIVEVDNPAPYTIEGLCCYLGITVQTFRNWRKNENNPELMERAQMLHQKITENRVSGALDGAQNSSFARFLLTNNNPDEYREKVEVEGNVNVKVKSLLDLCSGLKIKDGQDGSD